MKWFTSAVLAAAMTCGAAHAQITPISPVVKPPVQITLAQPQLKAIGDSNSLCNSNANALDSAIFVNGGAGYGKAGSERIDIFDKQRPLVLIGVRMHQITEAVIRFDDGTTYKASLSDKDTLLCPRLGGDMSLVKATFDLPTLSNVKFGTLSLKSAVPRTTTGTKLCTDKVTGQPGPCTGSLPPPDPEVFRTMRVQVFPQPVMETPSVMFVTAQPGRDNFCRQRFTFPGRNFGPVRFGKSGQPGSDTHVNILSRSTTSMSVEIAIDCTDAANNQYVLPALMDVRRGATGSQLGYRTPTGSNPQHPNVGFGQITTQRRR